MRELKTIGLVFTILVTGCTQKSYSPHTQSQGNSVLQATGAGANWYVRKGAAGSNTGTDWNNAWSEMNKINFGSVNCGDTIWIAGGSYTTALNGSKSCTSGSVLTINRVLSTDTIPTAAAGWSSSFDSQVILPNINIVGPAAYMTINGRGWQGGVLGSGGIQVLISGTEGDGIDASNNGNSGPAVDHLTWTYVEVFGPACVETQNCSGNVIGVNIMPYCSTANRTNLLFDHVSVHRTGEAFRACGWDSGIVQYSLIYDTHNDGFQHEDIQYTNPPYNNNTWRYNKIFQSPNDGLFFEYGGATNFQFYGNIYYHSGGWVICFKTGDTYGPVYIYNNLFENDGTFGDYSPGWLGQPGSLVAGSEISNNIFYNIDNQFSPTFSTYNAYSSSGYSETGSFQFTPGNPLTSYGGFVNMSAGNPVGADFHLTSSGVNTFNGKGRALASTYNMDIDGNQQGNSGTGSGWSVGPYAVVSGNPNPTPVPTPVPTPTPAPTPNPTPIPSPTPSPTPSKPTTAIISPVNGGLVP